jgi:ABC-2 type transport system permease protein
MLSKIKRYIKIHINSLKYDWLAFTVYRTQAVIWGLVILLSSISGVVTISVIYNISNGINGWNYYQVLMLVGLTNMMAGMFHYFGLDGIPNKLRNGGFDQMLVKPYNPIGMLLLFRPQSPNIITILTGFGIFATSAYFLNLGVINILVILLLFFIGVATFIMFMLTLYLVFYVLTKGKSQWLRTLSLYIGGTASSYPLNIFGTTLMILFTIVLPVGLATYYPAGFVFGKISLETLLLLIIFEIISIVVYYKLSKWLLTKYTSAGG